LTEDKVLVLFGKIESKHLSRQRFNLSHSCQASTQSGNFDCNEVEIVRGECSNKSFTHNGVHGFADGRTCIYDALNFVHSMQRFPAIECEDVGNAVDWIHRALYSASDSSNRRLNDLINVFKKKNRALTHTAGTLKKPN